MSCTAFLVSYLNSNWVASDLPVRYGITNDKWPVNSSDGIGTINSISDENGYARVTLASTVGGFAEGSYVKVSGATVDSYNGVWRVRQAFGTTDIVIEAPYNGTDTGSFQRYYNNYHIKVKVYTGIRSGHSLNSERPMALRGTLEIRPDGTNTAIADISSFVRSDLSPIDNHFCELTFDDGWTNDFNQWTQFYIEFAESYDTVTAGVLSTFTSDYVLDKDINDNALIYSAAKAANSFQYAQGKSMAEYSLNPTNYDGAGKFMTTFEKPTYFQGYEWDLSIINDYKNSDFTLPNQLWIQEYDTSGNLLATSKYEMPEQDEGIYRFDFGHHVFNASCDYFVTFVQYDRDDNTYNSQNLTVKYRNPCNTADPVYLRWINQVGGWDGWLFIRNKDLILDVTERTTVTRDIFNNWDTDFTRGTTQDDFIYTEAVQRRVIRSQLLSEDEARNIGNWLKVSNKVQEIYLSTDTECGNDERRTVLIEPGQFTYLTDARKVREIQVAFRYTDRMILPSQ